MLMSYFDDILYGGLCGYLGGWGSEILLTSMRFVEINGGLVVHGCRNRSNVIVVSFCEIIIRITTNFDDGMFNFTAAVV